jgi:hypothetical protein
MAKKYLRGPDVDARYGGINPRTRKAWVLNGNLPKPVIRGGIEYYDEAELDECDARDKAAPRQGGMTLH